MLNKIAFIGAGSMAEAVIAGIINTGFLRADQVHVANKENVPRLKELESEYKIWCSNDKKQVMENAEVVIFATKPHDMENALKDVAPFITEKQLVLSVVAGVSTDFIVDKLGKEIAVIRSMPNTSAMIGFSATAITKGKYANDDDMKLAREIFEAIGTVSVVKEEQMHAVTGISGSGPAYVYYLVEAMQNAAAKEGLDPETAKQLITQTIIGAGNMLKNRSEMAAQLRENVTSPNGTTAAGISTLESYKFLEAVETCVINAAKRSSELGK